MSNEKHTMKNATIELMRFIFASAIVLFHTGRDVWTKRKIVGTIGAFKISFFRRGYYGVEFFFLLTGLLMAASIWRSMESSKAARMPVGEETVFFLSRKSKAIAPFYLTACAMMILVNLWQGTPLKKIAEKLPSILFLNRFGFTKEKLLTVAWYLAAMLIALAVVYPLCRKFYGTFTTLIAPLVGLTLLGILVHETGDLVEINERFLFTYKMNLRAIAEISLGATCFEIARRLENKPFSDGKRLLFSLIAAGGFAATLIYMASFAPKRKGWIVVLFLCPALVITWSRIGLIGRSGVLQRKFFLFLGSLSLPLYLFQNIPRAIVPVVLKNARPGVRAVSAYLLSLALALIACCAQKMHHRCQTPVVQSAPEGSDPRGAK